MQRRRGAASTSHVTVIVFTGVLLPAVYGAVAMFSASTSFHAVVLVGRKVYDALPDDDVCSTARTDHEPPFGLVSSVTLARRPERDVGRARSLARPHDEGRQRGEDGRDDQARSPGSRDPSPHAVLLRYAPRPRDARDDRAVPVAPQGTSANVRRAVTHGGEAQTERARFRFECGRLRRLPCTAWLPSTLTTLSRSSTRP